MYGLGPCEITLVTGALQNGLYVANNLLFATFALFYASVGTCASFINVYYLNGGGVFQLLPVEIGSSTSQGIVTSAVVGKSGEMFAYASDVSTVITVISSINPTGVILFTCSMSSGAHIAYGSTFASNGQYLFIRDSNSNLFAFYLYGPSAGQQSWHIFPIQAVYLPTLLATSTFITFINQTVNQTYPYDFATQVTYNIEGQLVRPNPAFPLCSFVIAVMSNCLSICQNNGSLFAIPLIWDSKSDYIFIGHFGGIVDVVADSQNTIVVAFAPATDKNFLSTFFLNMTSFTSSMIWTSYVPFVPFASLMMNNNGQIILYAVQNYTYIFGNAGAPCS